MELDELDGTVGVRPVAEAAAVELQDGGPGGGKECRRLVSTSAEQLLGWI